MKSLFAACIAALICSPAWGQQPACDKGEEKVENMCYAKCKDKFEGKGDMCWEKCPSNSTDLDNRCLMGPTAYRKKFYSRAPGRPLDGAQ